MVVCPDINPRGDGIPDASENWHFGKGVGFLSMPASAISTNYRMSSYIIHELPELIATAFPADTLRQGIFGHSIDGHSVLTMESKHLGRFQSYSAFVPIYHLGVATWSRAAFQKYLGSNEKT